MNNLQVVQLNAVVEVYYNVPKTKSAKYRVVRVSAKSVVLESLAGLAPLQRWERAELEARLVKE